MNSAPKKRVQLAAAGTAVLALLGATGCSAVNEQATTIEYSASDGIVDRVGPVLLRNILIITSDEGEPGTLLGTLFNESDSPVQVTIDGENENSQVTIDANGKYVFEDEVGDDGILEGISEIPGALVDLEFTVNSESESIRVPVLDGTLEEYREFVPGGYTPPPTPIEEVVEEEEEL
ncbi:hypothetical protein GCM10009784_16170 [Arthrobacter parietis]|uniref:DNA modification methylase n=2 Tax=Arthrobacter TaxID=1663 RepID=A0ABT6CTS1_9MICC|nr:MULTISPECIES: hypothetical protein [Arthrobacter]KRF09396.1 hypothetical protein ASH00_07205 [Arthrobacter sp. Soil782]MDF9277466.1 hypothetical protein [Arthrobacter vasquezii]